MKLLGLHGMGSNSDVFEVQLQPILQSLPGFDCVFLDALFDAEPHHDLLGYSSGPCYWHGDDTIKSLEQSYEYIHDFICDEGPFDGIIAFSQGAAAAATVLLHHQHLFPYSAPLCDFVIFLNGISAYHIAEGMETGIAPKVMEKNLLQIPSIHVIGRKDKHRDESLSLYKLSESSCARMIEHDGGHSIPNNQVFISRLHQAINSTINVG